MFCISLLQNLSRQLVDHVNVTDPSTRRLCQSNMLQSGNLLENLGISLMELGRTTMMLRLGQTPVRILVLHIMNLILTFFCDALPFHIVLFTPIYL